MCFENQDLSNCTATLAGERCSSHLDYLFLSVFVGKTKAQVALRWLLQTEPVTSVIIGAKTLDQLNSNLEAGTGWKLTEEQVSIKLLLISLDQLNSNLEAGTGWKLTEEQVRINITGPA